MFTDLVILANFVWILVETIRLSGKFEHKERIFKTDLSVNFEHKKRIFRTDLSVNFEHKKRIFRTDLWIFWA